MSTGSETTVHRVTKISLLPIKKFERDSDSGEFYIRTIIASADDREFIFKLFSSEKSTLEISL